MIELTQNSGEKFSIDPRQVASVSNHDFGTRVAITGGWVYYAKESYKEVLQLIRGSTLETK